MNIYLLLFLMTIAQNASFTLISRARNSDSYLFHALAAVCSNGVWILVFRKLTVNVNDDLLALVYVAGSVIGSVLMHYISKKYIEPYFKKRQDARRNNR